MNLRQARQNGNLEEFIKEHENDEPADKRQMIKTLERMEQKPSRPSRKGTRKPSAGT